MNTTLVHLFDPKNNAILLARKNRGLGTGLWNGAGGKIDPGETPEAAAVREVKEEFGVDIDMRDLTPVAHLRFHFGTIPDWENFSYFVRTWSGTPAESADKEMTDLTWFPLDGLPYEEMWSDDRFWMPEVLAGNFVRAEFWFNNKNELLRHTIHAKEPL